VQRADRSARTEAAIEIVRDAQGVRIRHDHSIERRTFLVVRVDPREVLLDEGPARQGTVAEREFDLLDRRLVELKCVEAAR
jgi:hypothetical protein